MTPSLVFDLETIPDILAIRKLLKISDNLDDEDVVNIAMYQRRQKVGHDFLQHHFGFTEYYFLGVIKILMLIPVQLFDDLLDQK